MNAPEALALAGESEDSGKDRIAEHLGGGSNADTFNLDVPNFGKVS